MYLNKDDIPCDCTECLFLNSLDECILQDEHANFYANDSFDVLMQGCPIREGKEVIHAKWNQKYDNTYHCSNCDTQHVFPIMFCKHCGATMDNV